MEKRMILYAVIIIICVISIGLGIYAQFFYENGDTDGFMLGNTTSPNIDKEIINEKEEAAKENLDSIFINALTYETQSFNNPAVLKDKTHEIVYTSNQTEKSLQGKYSININIPAINIASQTADSINSEIETIFVKKATEILVNAESSTENIIYNIDYAAYLRGNILSLIIKATLKEGGKPQRIMYLGYNYNIETNQKITLQEYIEYKNITSATLQNKINKEIKEISKKNQDLSNIGFTVYTRDPNNAMYKVENTNNFFLGPNNYVYVIYAYGNNNYTSEKDVIVF